MKTGNYMLVLATLMIAMAVLPLKAQVTLPFSDDFESGTDGEAYTGTAWTYSGIPARASSTAKMGSLGLYSPGSATLPVAAEKMWFNYYTIMNPVDTTDGEPPIGTDAAAFFMDTTGAIHAYSNNTYVVVKTGLDTNAWHGFAVQLDYANKTWNLYYKAANASDSDPYGSLNTSPLAFRDGFTESASTEIEVRGATYLDEVLAEVSVFAATSTWANIRTAALLLEGAASGVSLEYFGTSGSLFTGLGAVLETVFSVGDELHFWDHATTNFVVCELEAGGWNADFTFTPTTGFFIVRDGSEKSSAVLVGYDETYVHTGVDTTVSPGWNLLSIPLTAGSRALSNSGLPAGLNDQVFLWTTDGWSISRYNGSNWTPNLTLPAGRTFWLRRRTAGDDTWSGSSI